MAGCSYPGGAGSLPTERIIAWLDRYVKGLDVDTGPTIEWEAQDGRYFGAPRWPLPATSWVTGGAVHTGTLAGPGPGGGDGPADGNPAPDAELRVTAVREPVFGPASRSRSIVGIPRVDLTGTVTGLKGFVFLELVDVSPDGTGPPSTTRSCRYRWTEGRWTGPSISTGSRGGWTRPRPGAGAHHGIHPVLGSTNRAVRRLPDGHPAPPDLSGLGAHRTARSRFATYARRSVFSP